MKSKYRFLTFSIVLLTSGFVYISSIVFLLFIFHHHLVLNKPSFRQIVRLVFLAFIIFSVNFFGQNNGVKFSELAQLLIFTFLVISLSEKKLFPKEFIKSICKGFLIGSIIMAINFIVRHLLFGDLTQDSLIYFSISGTYNYSAFYMFFGLILSPAILFRKTHYKVILLILFCLSLYIIQTRSSFILGLIFFLFLTLEIKNTFRFVVLSLIFFISISYFLDSSFVDKNNQNDIIYSITNFENNTSNLERLQMFTNSFNNLSLHPYGAGAGNTEILLKKTSIDHPHAHNTLANWLYEMGYFGIVLFLLFIYSMLRYIKLKKGKASKEMIVIVLFVIISSQISSLQYNILVTCITYMAMMLLKLLKEYSKYD